MDKPDFEAEIIIDENGKITVRNCNDEMIELLHRLNPKNESILKRVQLIRKINSKRRNQP